MAVTVVIPREHRTIEGHLPMKDTLVKAAGDKVDYVVNWARWLVEGDAIATSTFAIAGPAGSGTLAVCSSPAASHTDETATVWLEAGLLNTTYVVTNSITTSGGRQAQRSFRVRIQER